MSEELGLSFKKSKDFGKWYLEVIKKAQMADQSPVEGCMIFTPISYAIWENIQKYMDKRIKETGHSNVYFPLFIPEAFLKKEAEHFSGFIPEVAWVTEGGNSKLNEKLALRPTSETIMYYTFSKWIRSHRDLPLLINQWCNIVRWETKAAKPFLRTKEFLWQEGHTAHATEKEAKEEVLKMLNVYKEVMETQLAIPVIAGTKTESEKFKGAVYTTTIEAMMPDGKALQMGTSHNLGQNFSKPFKISFLDKDKKNKYVWQTSWGVSTRTIGALVMVHGDDKGLIMPPKVAPYQAVIIPIYKTEVEKKYVCEVCKKIEKKLLNEGVRVLFDKRDQYTPGFKFNEWELKGVPLRIEIGPNDVKKNQLVLVRRDGKEKITIKEKEIKKVKKVLENIQENLFNKAKKFFDEHIFIAKDFNEFKKIMKEKKGFIKTCWCGSQECEEKIKEKTTATIRCIQFEKEKVFSNCVYCGKKAREVVYFAKSY
jgi:prolyl-tRNA synthetase